MLPKLLKLKANDAIRSGATTMNSSGSVTFRNTCHGPPPSTRAASVSSVGIDWSAPSEIEEEVREGQPDAHEDHGDLRPVGVEEPRDVDVQELVDDPEVVVQKSLPDEQRQEAGNRVREDEEHAVRALEVHPRLVERRSR